MAAILCVTSAQAQSSDERTRAADELAAALKQEAANAFTWRVTWTAINGGITLLPIGGLFVLPRSQRGDLIVSAVSSGISTLLSWLFALSVEQHAITASQLGSLAPALRLAHTRDLFARSAEDERDRVSWPWHVGTFVLAALPAAIILFAFHHAVSSVVTFATGVATGELALLTQPVALVDAEPRLHGALDVSFVSRNYSLGYAIAW